MSRVLLVVGVALALALAVLAFWPDLEASLFDLSFSAEKSISRLQCPLALTPSEAGQIRATFSNPTDRRVQFLVRARITRGSLSVMRREDTAVVLEPGDEQTLHWDISAENVAYDRMILARIYALPSFPLPLRQRTCGIYLLRLPGSSGRAVVTTAAVVSLVSLGLGSALWRRFERPQAGRRNATRTIGAIAGLSLLAMGASMLGWWVVGLLSLVALMLLVAVLLERRLLGR